MFKFFTRPALAWTSVFVLLFFAIFSYRMLFMPARPAISNFSGPVKISRNGSNKWEFVQRKGIRLNEGDVVKTFSGAMADITVKGSYYMRLKGDSELKLADLPGKSDTYRKLFYRKNTVKVSVSVMDGVVAVSDLYNNLISMVNSGETLEYLVPGMRDKIVYSLEKGDVLTYYNKIQDAHKEFNINTKTAMVSAIGTDFMVGTTPAGDKTWVGVLSGIVSVSGKDPEGKVLDSDKVFVKPGEKTSVDKGASPKSPERLLSDDIMMMRDLYGIGKTTQVALLISTGPTRTRELLESRSLYITNQTTGELSDETAALIRDMNKALKERNKNRYRENIKKFEKMIKDSPNPEYEMQFLLFIGAYYWFIDDYKEALYTFQSAINKYPRSDLASIASCSMGIIYEEKLNDPIKAALMYNKVLTDYPDSPEVQEAQAGLERLRT